MDVVNNALMPGLHQAQHHVGSHPAQTDHSQLHFGSSCFNIIFLTGRCAHGEKFRISGWLPPEVWDLRGGCQIRMGLGKGFYENSLPAKNLPADNGLPQ
jgi:hypothetical protein